MCNYATRWGHSDPPTITDEEDTVESFPVKYRPSQSARRRVLKASSVACPMEVLRTSLGATLAFEDAGREAALKREAETVNNSRKGDGDDVGPGTNSISQETKSVPVHHEASQQSNGDLILHEHQSKTERLQKEEEDETPSEAILKIQSVFRGHQERQLIKKQSEMAVKIQRRFRRHLSDKSNHEHDDGDAAGLSKKEDLALRKEQREHRARAWKEDMPELLRRTYSVHVGEKTQEEFKMFQDEITGLKWKSEQQIERNVYGETHSPRRVLFISSNVQKSELLAEARLEGVLTFHYDFTKDTFENLIHILEVNLEAYKPGCKARSICFVSQGAPGALYLLKKRALTVEKLKKESEADQVRFWEAIGKCMSKISYHESMIHFMGCNVAGNEKGQMLFDNLEKIMTPSIVKIKSPLELSEEGQEMIASYFDLPKYKTWKMRRYSKTD